MLCCAVLCCAVLVCVSAGQLHSQGFRPNGRRPLQPHWWLPQRQGPGADPGYGEGSRRHTGRLINTCLIVLCRQLCRQYGLRTLPWSIPLFCALRLYVTDCNIQVGVETCHCLCGVCLFPPSPHQARFKYPPHWVPLPMLYEAMSAVDPTTGQPRGYLRLSANARPDSVLFTLDIRPDGSWRQAEAFIQSTAPELVQAAAASGQATPEALLRQLVALAPLGSVPSFIAMRFAAQSCARDRCVPHTVRQQVLRELRATPLHQVSTYPTTLTHSHGHVCLPTYMYPT